MTRTVNDPIWGSGLLPALNVVPSGSVTRRLCSTQLEKEHLKALNRIAMEIFIDMVNSGFSIHATIAAIYMSGLHHGTELAREP